MPTLAERGISLDDPRNDFLRLEPYLPAFGEAAAMEGEDACLLAAICLRETWAGWAPGYAPKGSHLGRGDHGHGFGLFQIDDRGPYKHWPKECPEATPLLQARWACWVLRDARKELSELAGLNVYMTAVLCAYNAGSPRVLRACRIGADPNLVTASKNYGSDVLRRRDLLRTNHPDRFPLPPPRVA